MSRPRHTTMVGAYVIAGPYTRCAKCKVALFGRRALKSKRFGDVAFTYECATSCDLADGHLTGPLS